MNSNNPDVLKTTISFFQNVPVHQLVEWGLVSRCINILAGEGVIATASTKPTNNDDRYSYYPMTRKNINVLKDNNLSLEILDLLYNILLDGEYAGVAVEEADDGLAVIQNYLSDQFGNQICEKSECILLLIVLVSFCSLSSDVCPTIIT